MVMMVNINKEGDINKQYQENVMEQGVFVLCLSMSLLVVVV
jgi:hypothetical protein